MVKVTNDFGDCYSGSVGDSGTFATIWGIQYRRRKVKPSNPNTVAQQKVRNSFTNGVDKWHTFNPLQAEAYKPLASGLKMSGYNLFISRWQKLTDAGRAAYVEPIVGFKQIASGPATADQTQAIVENQKEYTIVAHPLVRDSITFAKGAGDLDPVLLVDIQRGKVTVLKTIAAATTISYSAGGEAVVDEAITSSAEVGEVFYLEHMDITYKSCHVKQGASEVPSLEVDVDNGKFYVEGDDTFTAGGTITYDSFTPLENANLKMVKANTSFNTLNKYSDANGVIRLSQTAEDGNRDISYSEASHISIVKGNVTPSTAAKDELIVMTAI